tara:strand:- start:63 stop:257 length:195 start_codon:yes stop_codon:yes gene_type:complete
MESKQNKIDEILNHKSKAEFYFGWLNNNVEYQNWLKACPYQFVDFREKSDLSIQIKFKNSHLFD